MIERTTLSHATVLYALGYAWLVFRRARLLWLNRRPVLIGRVYETPFRVSAAMAGAGAIRPSSRMFQVAMVTRLAGELARGMLEA